MTLDFVNMFVDNVKASALGQSSRLLMKYTLFGAIHKRT